MIKNYFKIAIRGYFRDRLFTSLNLMSLVIGLLVAYLAIDYISYEFSFDKSHKKAADIHRLGWTYRSQDYSIIGFENYRDATISAQLVQINALKNVQGIENIAQFITSEALEYIECAGKRIQEKDFLTTNTPAAFVDMFTWKLKGGSFLDFSNGLNKAILTVSTAEKLFGKAALNDPSVFSKTLKIGNENYALSAIIEDVPLNSHIPFNVVLNKKKIDYWGGRVYVQLAENLDYKSVENTINASMGLINPRISKDPLYKKHFLQPITDIHLKSNILYEMKPPGNYKYIWVIGVFAFFIIIITLFNYANLSLAIQSKKSKAIGVRKVLGAQNTTIAQQFIIDSTLLSIIALPIVCILITLITPLFNKMMGVGLNPNIFDAPRMFLTLFLIAIIMGILAGLTPALYLSSKNILNLFKENLRSNHFQHFPIRKYLIINQFVILIGITAVSYFISKQMDFIAQKDMGFQKEGIVYAYCSPENQNVFQQKLRQIPEIKTVGNGSTFGITSFNKSTYKLADKADVFDDAQQLELDYEALKAYKLKTTLDKKSIETTEKKPVITLINRTAAEKLAKVQQTSVEKIIGVTIVTEPEYVAENGQVGTPFTVSGIFEDINLFSLHEKIEPYFITISENVRLDGRTIIAYNPAQTAQVLAKVQGIFNELNEPFPLELTFLTDNIEAIHKTDSRIANLLFYFNIIAVLLASIGIIGITLFMVVLRTKEIGVRKVLGASPLSIIQSLVKEYIYFIGIALLISYPIAYFGVYKWLSNFAYRIDIQHIMFLIIGFIAFIVTALLVGIIAYKAAVANPVKSLRTE